MTIIVHTIASASARDYDWLLTSLATWNGRRTDLAALIPDFVMLAEKRINADLEGRFQESVLTLTAAANVQTTAIPDDAAEIRALSIAQYGPLEYLTPNQFSGQFTTGATGVPRFFTLIGQAIYLGPTPEADFSIACAYRAFVPALADSAGTNWLIQRYPNVYLTAAMCEVLSYTKNFAELPVWEKKYADAIDTVNKPDWSNASPMTVRSDARP